MLDDFQIHRRNFIFDGIPILTGNTKVTGKQNNVLCFKRHSFGVALVEHIDGDITLKQLQRSLLGERQHIGIGVTVGIHRFDRHGRVGHITVVGSLNWFFFLYIAGDFINGIFCGILWNIIIVLRFLDIGGKNRVFNLFRYGLNERSHNLIGATDEICRAALVALHCGSEVLVGNVHKFCVRSSFFQILKERLRIVCLFDRIRNQLIGQGHNYILTSGVGVGIEIHGFKRHSVWMMIEPVIISDWVFGIQSIQFFFLHDIISSLSYITSLPFCVSKVVCLFLGHALFHEVVHHFKDIHFFQWFFFGLNRHFRFTLFHNLRIVAVDVSDKLGGGFIDGFKTCTKLFQLLIFRPGCNIAEAVFARSDAIIGTYSKGNAFCLDFLGVSVFLLFIEETLHRNLAADKVQASFLCQVQATVFAKVKGLCRNNRTGVIDSYILFDRYRHTGVIVRATQIIAV